MTIQSVRFCSIMSTICLLASNICPAQGQTVFHVLSYQNRFGGPSALIEGSPGVFYFNTGSSIGVFSISTQGSKTTLATLPAGDQTASATISGANNRFYSSFGPNNSSAYVFSVSSTPGEQTYSDQTVVPVLTQNLPDTDFLGVAIAFADNPWYLVDVDLQGNVTIIYQFPSDEVLPNTAVYASDGNYYGISQNGVGYVYKVTPAGSLTKLLSFPNLAVTGFRFVPLIQASDGNLYGAAPGGGGGGAGTIYKLTLSGQYTLLYTFPKNNTSVPTSLIEGSDGNLYGTTLGQIPSGGYSTIFKITKTGQYSEILAMKNISYYGACQCQLVQGSDGKIYGSAISGGTYNGGVIFSLDLGLPQPSPRAKHFYPQAGAPGTSVRIWGDNLLGASVEFDGVAAATVSNSGSNYVYATVPVGATSGPITISTAGGSMTTESSFTVE